MTALPCMTNKDWWFPEGYLGKAVEGDTVGQPDYHTEEAMAARALCAGCPLRQRCLDMAIEQGEAYGIYGGLDPNEREVETVKRAMRAMR